MYDEWTRTVPLGWETCGSGVIDWSFIVTCTMFRREQYRLFGKLVVLLSLNHRLLLHVRYIDKIRTACFGKLVVLLSLIHRLLLHVRGNVENSTTCLGNWWFCCRCFIVYCYMYEVTSRTVPLVWETSGSIVVDSSFFVTYMMYRRKQ